MTLTGHFYTAGIFNINKDFYESLEGQDKEWFDEASAHFVENLTQLIRDAQEGYIQLLKDNGINVVSPPSRRMPSSSPPPPCMTCSSRSTAVRRS